MKSNLLTLLADRREIETLITDEALDRLGEIFIENEIVRDPVEWWVHEVPVHFESQGKVIELDVLAWTWHGWKVRVRQIDAALN